MRQLPGWLVTLAIAAMLRCARASYFHLKKLAREE
jgi:hypothetical protein